MMRGLAFACALLLVAGQAPAAEPLGRLFFTPVQRASLDVARSQKTRITVDTDRTEETAAPAPEVLTYGGIVRRSDGKSTVWINNRALHDREALGGTSIVNRARPDGSIRLQVPQTGRSVDLKVGQSVELLSGTIEEGYARRAVTSKPEPKPAAKLPAPGAAPSKQKLEDGAGQASRRRSEPEEDQGMARGETPAQSTAPSEMPPRGN